MKPKVQIKAYRNLSQIVTLIDAYQKDGRNLKADDLTILENASIVFDDEKILWFGLERDFPDEYKTVEKTYFLEGKILTPEIVDSHTHIIFGGDRSFEYSMRLNGASYEQLAAAGGGIIHTVEATNKLSAAKLFELAKTRIETIHSYGVGTIEIKSGYALTYEKELELSTIIHDLKLFFAPTVQIKNTFMAAHAVPPQFKDKSMNSGSSCSGGKINSNEYLKQVVIPLLEELAKKKIIDVVDIFHEENYFSTEDVVLLFDKAKSLGIPTKIHADEFNNNGGAKLATEYASLSADHLLATDKDGIKALANSQTVATLLPGTGLFLGKKSASARDFLDAGVKVSIASDYNPGSCHCDNVILLASIAAPLYKMNLAEVWAAITLNAAHALDLRNQGVIDKGFASRFSLFNAKNINYITYNWGKNFSFANL
ncbi:MAG: imidazolonepropionase [Oligoflexia bacterium]|nr:imidazolonepropionase [Oligoflexia bacterium]